MIQLNGIQALNMALIPVRGPQLRWEYPHEFIYLFTPPKRPHSLGV